MTEYTKFLMLDLSTAHLTQGTRNALIENELEGVIYYPKGPWGFFVHVPDPADEIELDESVPQDIRDCISFAQKDQLQWLMFDCDAATIDKLPLYEEVEIDKEPSSTDSSVDAAQLRLIADGYARHLSRKYGKEIVGSISATGKILVRDKVSKESFYGEVSPAFAHAMAYTALTVREMTS